MIEVRRLSRPEIAARIEDVARLRISVFRDWPYLYEGDADYERRYLETYLRSPRAVMIGAFDGEALVGMATATPLLDHDAAFSEPLVARGYDPARIFYFGESVLLPHHRGQGIGVGFFHHRELAAREAGLATCLFSSVVRPSDHPSRPAGHVPLDGFWCNRGYRKLEGVTTLYTWRDVGAAAETEKPMEYWVRDLSEAMAAG